MTSEEYKKLFSEHSKGMSGSELADAMEDYMINESYRQSERRLPFFKKYQLRYLFYRVKGVGLFSLTPKNLCDTSCKKCKHPVQIKSGIFLPGIGTKYYCRNCGSELIEIKNTSFLRKINPIMQLFWIIMQVMHIVKTSDFGRYDLFGDEARYAYLMVDFENNKTIIIQKRKWWEYIFIKRVKN